MRKKVLGIWADGSFLFAILAFAVLFVTQLGCGALQKYRTTAANTTANNEPAPSAITEEWKEYTLEKTDIRIKLPGEPKLEPIPGAVQRNASVRVYRVPLGKGMIMVMDTKFPPGRPAILKDVAEASMTSFQRQDPDTEYEVSVVSDSKARVTGQTSAKFKDIANFSINGCYLIRNVKKTGSAWSIVVISDPSRAADVAQVMDSVAVSGIEENCR